jgi:hypothetical protein
MSEPSYPFAQAQQKATKMETWEMRVQHNLIDNAWDEDSQYRCIEVLDHFCILAS